MEFQIFLFLFYSKIKQFSCRFQFFFTNQIQNIIIRYNYFFVFQRTLLHVAVCKNDPEIVSLILNRPEINVNTRTIIK